MARMIPKRRHAQQLTRLLCALVLLFTGLASARLDAAASGERPAVHAPDACPNVGHNHAYCTVLGATPALLLPRLTPALAVAAVRPLVPTSTIPLRSRRIHLPQNPRAPPAT